jgi:hypothetical protein
MSGLDYVSRQLIKAGRVSVAETRLLVRGGGHVLAGYPIENVN